MKYSIRALIAIVTVVAVCFALIKYPSRLASEILGFGVPFLGCIGLVVAYHVRGVKASFGLTFGVFALAAPFMVPWHGSRLVTWIHENVTFDGPDTLPVGNFDDYGAQGIIAASLALLQAVLAATIAAGIRGKADDTPEELQP